MLYKNRIFQCMSKIFCVEFQRVPLKFHTKYLTHTLKDVNHKSFWNAPQYTVCELMQNKYNGSVLTHFPLDSPVMYIQNYIQASQS